LSPTETLKLLQRLLKSPGCRKIPVLVQNKDDVIVTASNFSSERYALALLGDITLKEWSQNTRPTSLLCKLPCPVNPLIMAGAFIY